MNAPQSADKDATRPIYCGATIDGPKVGRHVVAWRKWCRQRVKNPGDRCRFHGGPARVTPPAVSHGPQD